MSDCIFCKIVAGEIPCYKLYEDEHVLAFLDVGPLSEGHCLVIPKVHIQRLDDAGGEHEAVLEAIMRVVVRLGKAVMGAGNSGGSRGTEVPRPGGRSGGSSGGWNLLQNNGEVAGQVVGHVHFHIIPRREGDGLGYRWNAGQLDDDEAKRLAEAIGQRM